MTNSFTSSAGLLRPGARGVDAAGRALRAAVFDGPAAYLEGRQRVLLAPDGELLHLPFETLPAADGRRLLDHYVMSYVGSGRDLLRWGQPVTGASPALVLADLDYDDGKPPAALVAAPKSGGWWSWLLGGRRAEVAPPEPGLEGEVFIPLFERLPGSRAEGQAVAALTGGQLVTGQQGRKQSFLNCHSPWLLHLTTPTFALSDPPRTPPGQAPGPRPPEPRWQNPLRRAGFALTAANDRGADAEAGLVTARDLSALDLSHTQLVTLSLADTQAGHGRTARVLVGLQRALVLAGARTVVLSLWRTPDQPRRELLEDFYRRLLAGQSRVDALREAKLSLKVRYADPLCWGAFVCHGETTPIRKG